MQYGQLQQQEGCVQRIQQFRGVHAVLGVKTGSNHTTACSNISYLLSCCLRGPNKAVLQKACYRVSMVEIYVENNCCFNYAEELQPSIVTRYKMIMCAIQHVQAQI